MVAAGNNAWSTVKVLLTRGANMAAIDTKNRNFLHLAIISGVNLHELGIEVFQVGIQNCKCTSVLRGIVRFSWLTKRVVIRYIST